MKPIDISDQMYRNAWAKSRDYKKKKMEVSISDILGEEIFYTLFDDPACIFAVRTKQCDYEPLPHHECKVHKSELLGGFDAYAFIRISEDGKRAWFLGTISKMEFFAKATLEKDFYKLKIGDLNGQ